jgi:hypothetical protein
VIKHVCLQTISGSNGSFFAVLLNACSNSEHDDNKPAPYARSPSF